MTGSKVTAILLHGWILPICGVASRRVCGRSLRSMLVFFIYRENKYIVLLFCFVLSWEPTNYIRRIWLSKKRLCFAFVFSSRGLKPQNLQSRTHKISRPFSNDFFLFLDLLNYFLQCQLNLSEFNVIN